MQRHRPGGAWRYKRLRPRAVSCVGDALDLDRLTYIGHSTTLVRLGSTSVLTDPALRGWIGPLRRYGPAARFGLDGVDAALISHLHCDHLDLPSLRRLPRETSLVVPRGAAGIAAKAGTREIREIALGQTIGVGGLTITAVPAMHDGRRARWGRAAQTLGFVIAGGGRRVYFAGDTELYDGMAELGPLDVALLPVWGWGPSLGHGHLDPAAAARALTLLRPDAAVPIHWGTFYPLGLRRLRPRPLSRPPLEFARRAAELAPEVKVRVLEPGEMMAL
jgi:L-ascorbate metabolism protein UlaG (beta-lactamase superfamily)